MSVILEKKYIGELTSQLLDALKNKEKSNGITLSRVLDNHKDFIFDFHYVYSLKINSNIDDCRENYKSEWVERRMWEILIGNITVYSLQYQDYKINSFYDHVEIVSKAKCKPFDSSSCFEMIQGIDYNLSTNDGNRFISEKNEKFIQMLEAWLNNNRPLKV